MSKLLVAVLFVMVGSLACAGEVIEGCGINQVLAHSAVSPYLPKIAAFRGYDVTLIKNSDDLARIGDLHIKSSEGFSKEFSINAEGDRTYIFESPSLNLSIVIKADGDRDGQRIGFIYDLTQTPAIKAVQLICY